MRHTARRERRELRRRDDRTHDTTRASASWSARLPAWLPLVAVLGVAFTTRVVVMTQLAEVPLFRLPWLDSAEYLDWGRRLIEGAAWPANPPHGPGYPLFIAGVFSLFGNSLDSLRFIQALMGSLGCVLTTVLGTHYFGKRAGLAAGLGQALYGPLVLVDVSILAEGLLIFFLLVALWAATVGRSTGWRLAAGIALGCAVITRPTALLVLPIVLWGVLRESVGRERLVGGAAVLLAATLIVAPVVLKNWVVAGTPTVQAFGGLNFYLGNSPTGNGLPSARPGAAWQVLNNEAARNGVNQPVGQDRYYIAKTLREITQHPAGFARVVLSKAAWTLQAEEIRDTHSYYFFASESALLALLPRFGIVLPFALLGLVVAVRQRKLTFLLAGYIGVTAATCVVLVVGSRYRLPMMPGLIVLAGFGIMVVVRLLLELRARRFEPRAAVSVITVVAVGCAIPQLRRHQESHDFAEEYVYTGKSLEAERRIEDAERAYRRAVAANPRAEYAWDRLGALLIENGRRDEGCAALQRAVSLAPDYPDGAYHLGLCDEDAGAFDRAADRFRKAVGLAPDVLQYRQALARVQVSAGHYEEAERMYATLVRQWPDDASSHVGLAFLLNSRNESGRAVAEARRASSLDARNPQAWLVLTRAAIDARQLPLAEAALREATALLGADPPEIQYLRNELRQAR